MDFNTYQEAATRTANKELDIRTALAVSALGVTGEAGEVAEHIKKHIGHDHNLDHSKVAKELGDVLWYVSEMCTLLGVSLETVAMTNIAKLRARYPEKFDPERSKHRKIGDE